MIYLRKVLGTHSTSNVIPQTSVKVVISGISFPALGLVGSLTLEKQNLCLPNQVVHDPDTWTTPHFLYLKWEYEVLVNNHGYLVQEMYTVQDPSDPPSEIFLLSLLKYFSKLQVQCTHSGVTSTGEFSTLVMSPVLEGRLQTRDYNNRPSNVMSFMSTITSTSGSLHGEFVLLFIVTGS
jgi:hypothetical protein